VFYVLYFIVIYGLHHLVFIVKSENAPYEQHKRAVDYNLGR